MPNEIPKTDSQLDTAIDIPMEDLENSNLNTGYDENTNKWEVIVRYNGDLQNIADTLDVDIEILLQGYAIITLEADKIRQLAMYPQIEYIEKPKRLQLVLNNSLRKSCITQVQNQPPNLNGAGVIVGIIDSGIDYTHPDFINSDGTSRILYIWDQSINGNPPQGFTQGYEFTKADIDRALSTQNSSERQQIIPHMDNVGHGTAVAGVAAGNGRASRGRYTGVAPESSLIVVKLGERGRESFARTTELMRGIKYVIEKASELNMPLALNISFGTNDGSHDGSSIFETYIDDASNIWRTSIVVASGNEGAAAHHFRGRVANGGSVDAEFTVAQGLRSLSVTMWKSFVDRMSIEIIAPNGVSTGIVPFNILSGSYILGNSKVYVVFGQPTPYNADQEIFFEIIPNNQYLSEGIWIIRVYGDDIVEGTFDIWLPTTEIASSKTAFVDPDIYITLTLPSTSASVITVGGYNSVLDSVTDFSGKGYNRNGIIKPDLVAPAVNITAPAVGGGYDSFTGTSIAAPHVTGSAALLMQWGIVNGNDLFLYGQKLKSYLKLGAVRIDNNNFPNREWGYGSLCLKNTLDNLMLMQDNNSIVQNVEIQQHNGSIEEFIYSNDYIDLIAEYNSISQNIIDDNEYIKHCRIIDNNYAILYINKNDYIRFITEYSNRVSFQEPFILGLMDYAALDAAGILNVQVQPYLNLRGRGVLVAIIDTGIDYTNDIFRYEDGTSKIVSIWDQTIENGGSGRPGELCYGTEYTNEQINLALRSENPFDIVPSRDLNGHGTFLAGMSAGRDSTSNNFIGAAPDAELIVVKLKESKPYLKEMKAIFTDAPSYQSNDLMTAVNYVYEKANTLGKPIAICIALGTNEGGHSGQSLLETYLEGIALRNGVAICEACGNEGNARNHAYEILAQGESKNLEIRVPEGERGFTVDIYAFISDKIAISITSPLGETIQKIQPVSNYLQEFNLNLSNTSVTVSFFIPARVTNDQRVNLKFVNPSPGIWNVTLIGEQVSLGAVHAWLPIENFAQPDTTFLSPDSYFTTVVPATGRAIIPVGGYNFVDDSLFISSSRGPNRLDSLKPIIVAPAVNINGIGVNNRPMTMTGTSVAASIVTGAAALLFEWGIVQERTGSMNSLTIMSYLIRGAQRRGEPYPNNLWGFGTIDLYNSFRSLL